MNQRRHPDVKCRQEWTGRGLDQFDTPLHVATLYSAADIRLAPKYVFDGIQIRDLAETPHEAHLALQPQRHNIIVPVDRLWRF